MSLADSIWQTVKQTVSEVKDGLATDLEKAVTDWPGGEASNRQSSW